MTQYIFGKSVYDSHPAWVKLFIDLNEDEEIDSGQPYWLIKEDDGITIGVLDQAFFKIDTSGNLIINDVVQGDIFYIDANGHIVKLAAGTNGHFLKTQGTGANPIWAAAAGGGDMLKSTYDTDDDGIVDNSEKLEGSTKVQVQDHTPKAHTLASHSTKAHSELTGVGVSDHHVKYTNAEALAQAKANIEDAPVNGHTEQGASSNWAFDHVAAADPHTGYILETLFDAYSILFADTDNTPAALSVVASRLIGRKASGGMAALTATEVKTILAIALGDVSGHDKAAHDALGLDHGDLSGKSDDDHSQYYNSTRHTKAIHDSLNINADQVDSKEASDFVWDSLFDAYSLLYADTDNTPAALTVAASRFVGRKAAGGIAAMTAAEAKAILAIAVADISDHDKAAHDALGLDHGALSGKADDDHSQYYNATRHTKAVHDALGIAPASHGADKHTNITRSLWIPVMAGKSAGTFDVTGALEMPDAADTIIYFWFMLPADLNAEGFSDIKIVGTVTGTGNVVFDTQLTGGVHDESYYTISQTVENEVITGVSANEDVLIRSIGVSITKTGYTKDHLCYFSVKREGGHASDTLAGIFHMNGILLEYTANQ